MENESTKSLINYIDDKAELIVQAFASVEGPQLKKMIPDVLASMKMEDLKAECYIELLGMSKQRIRCTLEGKELEESSDESLILSSDESSEKPRLIKTKSVVKKVSPTDRDEQGGYKRLFPDRTEDSKDKNRKAIKYFSSIADTKTQGDENKIETIKKKRNVDNDKDSKRSKKDKDSKSNKLTNSPQKKKDSNDKTQQESNSPKKKHSNEKAQQESNTPQKKKESNDKTLQKMDSPQKKKDSSDKSPQKITDKHSEKRKKKTKDKEKLEKEDKKTKKQKHDNAEKDGRPSKIKNVDEDEVIDLTEPHKTKTTLEKETTGCESTSRAPKRASINLEFALPDPTLEARRKEGQSLLELLELEMRAKAIRALLEREERKGRKIETIDLVEDEDDPDAVIVIQDTLPEVDLTVDDADSEAENVMSTEDQLESTTSENVGQSSMNISVDSELDSEKRLQEEPLKQPDENDLTGDAHENTWVQRWLNSVKVKQVLATSRTVTNLRKRLKVIHTKSDTIDSK